MSGSWQNLLINGAQAPITTGVLTPMIEDFDVGFVAHRYLLTIEQVTGGPSAAALQAYFQVFNPTTSDQYTEGYQGGIWTTLKPNSGMDWTPDILPDGDWPSLTGLQTIGTVTTLTNDVASTSGSPNLNTSSAAGSNPFNAGVVINNGDVTVPQVMQGAAVDAGYSNHILSVGGSSGAWTAVLERPAIVTNGAGNASLLNAYSVQRSIVGVRAHRLMLIPTFTGGTSPSIIASLRVDSRTN